VSKKAELRSAGQPGRLPLRIPFRGEKQKRDSFRPPLLMRPLGYKRMKVGIVLQTLDTGAGKRLFGRFQMEQALHRNRHLLLFYLFREFLEFAGQRTGDSPSNATGNIS
jgi:hypothetical protein